MVGSTITERGLGGLEALRIFGDVLAPACISIDHPRFLSFVPAAPTEAAILFDLVVGASSIYGGSWLEGGGAIFAENQALRWIADLAGLPASAGGVFVSGGTAGNLSALIAARWRWRHRAGGRHDRTRGLIVTSSGAHSSVAQAASAMDADITLVDSGRRRPPPRRRTRPESWSSYRTSGRATGCSPSSPRPARRTPGSSTISTAPPSSPMSTTCGSTSTAPTGWRRSPRRASAGRFAGVERADSLIVDPHKWLFAPFDSCALIYRDPAIGRAAHTQDAEYLDVLHDESEAATPAAGTRPTTPTTSPGGRVACRCGSAWRRTARPPTPRPIETTLRVAARRHASSTKPSTPS